MLTITETLERIAEIFPDEAIRLRDYLNQLQVQLIAARQDCIGLAPGEERITGAYPAKLEVHNETG